ncbi:MAG TPA: 1-(5-phosphoribosyl)-5-[(5-phosphoribosylamino)methylideneamino]imidazole-4-carboxamide isomerase [Dehalococcoidia bacterium]|nr:1-(5-phosphoribosyl)-5-[(5-phosphoribosylamino)methylideneamino]imidazole-4-carboxamide isomerase [Dehalococcoidia bacterium]
MEIIPAIDLRDGRCVRLYQGDYSRETVFSEEPVKMALRWQSMGARRMHIVDLDGAASGKPENIKTVSAMVKELSIPVQLGGGIRDQDTVKTLLGMGIDRLILGTIAVEKEDLVKKLCRLYGQRLIVSIDARDGLVSTHGWLKNTGTRAIDLARGMKKAGVLRIMYTDIKKDGTLTEPSFDAIAELVQDVGLPVIAAGGISSMRDLEKLAQIGAEGAIVGRAIYTGDLDLGEALKQIQNV